VNTLAADLSAAGRAQSLSLRAAAATAVVPTALAAQGMVMVGHDALGLSLAFAVALAAFLELALISSALLARASALAGRPAVADAVAVWVFSAVSGLFSAAHELIGPLDTATGQRGWQHDSLSVLAAGVRIAAPLVAAWLWERVLVSARRQATARSAVQIRADRRLLAFARAAQTLRRLLKSHTASKRQIRRAHRRFDRRHVALLRRVPATDPKLRAAIQQWLTELFCADTHYLDWTPPSVQTLSDTRAAVTESPVTSPSAAVEVSVSRSGTGGPLGHVSDTAQTLVTVAGQVLGTVPCAMADTQAQSLNVSATTQTSIGQSGSTTDPGAITPVLCVTGPDRVADTSSTSPRAFADVSATLASDRRRLSDAVEIVRAYSPLSGSDMAKRMGRCGHPMSERTGLRWRDRAEEHRQQRQILVPGD
jgi:hypothetical protein